MPDLIALGEVCEFREKDENLTKNGESLLKNRKYYGIMYFVFLFYFGGSYGCILL